MSKRKPHKIFKGLKVSVNAFTCVRIFDIIKGTNYKQRVEGQNFHSSDGNTKNGDL
jgi:hypothetical protein